MDAATRIGEALGTAVLRVERLQRASTVTVVAADLADGLRVVAKLGDGHQQIEARMLRDLAGVGTLPVPRVIHVEEGCLIMERLDHDGRAPGPAAQEHLADLMAALHSRPWPRFGWTYDTTIGQLPQPNPEGDLWVPFFRDHRLMHMADAGLKEGTVSGDLHRRLSRLAERIDGFLAEPDHPALLHGDLWTGNVLSRGDRITGIIDPALYVGHPEIELAFMTLFGTVGPRFFDVYRERAPFDADFFEMRRDLYNIYPLLVHVRYWDRAYTTGIIATLDRLGF